MYVCTFYVESRKIKFYIYILYIMYYVMCTFYVESRKIKFYIYLNLYFIHVHHVCHVIKY